MIFTGPDGTTVQAIAHHLIVDILNIWLLAGEVPAFFNEARTVLIPKKGDLNLIKTWRPLSIGHLLNILFCKILAKRLGNAIETHPRQKGFSENAGCGDNLVLLGGVVDVCKMRRDQLHIVFLDLAQAFDTISHTLIQELQKISTGQQPAEPEYL
jgi:hypothetical protein